MTELKLIQEDIADQERVLRVHVALTPEDLQAYFAMRQATRQPSEANSVLVKQFASRFADYVSDWSSFGITQYPKPLLASLPYNYFMTVEREHASGALLYLMTSTHWMGRAIFSHWDTWRAMLRAVGVGVLYDDLSQWSSYFQIMKRISTAKQFPRTAVWRELIESLVMHRNHVDLNVVTSVAYIMRCIRDGLELHRNSTRLIISDTGLVVDGPAILIDRRLP